MCVGLTFTHPLPRRPAAYGLSAALTTTPSCPAATSSSKNDAAAAGVEVTSRRHEEVRSQLGERLVTPHAPARR